MRRTQLTLAILLMAACSSPAGPSASTSGASAPATTATSSASAFTSAAPPVTVGLEEFATDLTAPIAMVSPPGEQSTTYVVDQAGLVLPVTAGGVEQDKPCLDVRSDLVELHQDRDDERGLLGLAFSPDFAADQAVYVFRTVRAEKAGLSQVNVLSRYRADAACTSVDPDSEQEIWRLEQVMTSHAAGQLAFDADGRLLVFMGDGQNPEEAQDP
ncbi:PQQ-dependent sugar dehydrogenase [Nostocoides australiense]